MAATDYSSLYKLCEHPDIVDIVAVQSLLSSSSPSTRTQLISYQNEDGRTPLYAACQSGHHQVVEILLAAGTNKETPDKYGWELLHAACWNGHHQVVEMLLGAGANKETLTKCGSTPLHVACEGGHNQAVELLLAAGVNKETLNYSRKKPIDVAGTGWGVKEENKQKVIKLLSSPLLPSRVSQIQSRIAQIRQRLNAKSSLPSPSPSPSPV